MTFLSAGSRLEEERPLSTDNNTTGNQAVPERKSQPGSASRQQRKLAGVISDQEVIAGFSRIKVAMVLSDPRADDNPIVYVNAAFERTTGYDRSSVVGRNCRFLQGEQTEKRDVDKIRKAIDAGEDVSVDITNYRADGRPFRNRLTIAPIFDADGEVLYYLGIQKELRESEREELEADAMLVNMRARVKDDLSLVLAGIGEIGDREDPHSFETVARRLECLQLAYESIKLADETKTGLRGIDLGALISRVAAAIAHEEGRAGIRYVQNIEPLAVNLDAAVRSALLLSEILSNAFHHAFDRLDEGFVELRLTRLASGGLRMVVTDDGVGLPSDAAFPNPETIGGRLITTLAEGLDATITPVRGAAGTVVMVDIPTGITDV